MKGAVLMCLSVGSFLSVSAGWAGAPLTGRPTVIDGDTLRVHGKVIRLYGIAAPRIDQTCLDANGLEYACGQTAAQALSARTANADIVCTLRDTEEDSSALAVCYKDKEDLSAWMVRRGYAVADREAQPSYVAEEQPAWGKRRGLWAGVFEDPTGRRREIAPSAPAMADVQP